MNIEKLVSLLVILNALVINGCASRIQGETFSHDDAHQVQTVQYGIIEALRMVIIEHTKTPIGSTAGAIVSGNSIGQGKGAIIAGVLGAAVGG